MLLSDITRAATSCLPPPNFESGYLFEGSFDLSNILIINCSISLNDIMDSTIEQLPILAVLTSQPESLSREQIAIATKTLSIYLEKLQDEVSYK